VLVSLYNPLLSFVSLMVLPLSEIYAHPSDMLAVMAEKLGGSTFRTILCIDAVTILCGGVLTSIVGKYVPVVIRSVDCLHYGSDFFCISRSWGRSRRCVYVQRCVISNST
jgi:hypothetical protein